MPDGPHMACTKHQLLLPDVRGWPIRTRMVGWVPTPNICWNSSFASFNLSAANLRGLAGVGRPYVSVWCITLCFGDRNPVVGHKISGYFGRACWYVDGVSRMARSPTTLACFSAHRTWSEVIWSIKGLLCTSTTSPKWCRKSASIMASVTWPTKNVHEKALRNPVFTFTTRKPSVFTREPFALYKSTAGWPAFRLQNFDGKMLTSLPVSTR